MKKYKLVAALLAMNLVAVNIVPTFANGTTKDIITDTTTDSTIEPEENKIKDIQGHWAESGILSFIEQGYIKGYGDNTFKPDNSITRAEFVKLVNRVFGFKEVQNFEEEKFTDVNLENWYYYEITTALHNGYINGNDSKFRPNDNITRQEISTIITNIMNNKDPKIDRINQFSDADKISKWAEESLEGAIENGIIGGYEDNTIRPKEVATRAQAVSILSRITYLQDKEAGTALLETNNYSLKKYEPRVGTYLGSYVMQDTVVNANMDEFEKMTGKKHASYFHYLGYKKGDLEKYDSWMKDVVDRGGIPHVALEPNQGLDSVHNDQYLEELAKMFGKFKSPIFLRYASEMNGNWVSYHGNPSLYREKWRLVHDVMEKYAPNVIMVWTPYEKPVGNILDYYPGDEYVDWVGVNAYNVVYRNNDITKPVSDDPLEMIDFVYDHFSNRKPIQISEYGATHNTISDDKDYTDYAIEKIERLYGNIWEKYPRIKSIFYFNVNNIATAPVGRQINNYSLTENQRYLEAYRNIIKDDHFLSDIKPNAEGKSNREVFTLTDNVRQFNGQKYINISNMIKILGGQVFVSDEIVKYEINKKVFDFKDIAVHNEVTYVNVNEFAKVMGYKVENRGSDDTIILKKI